MPAHVQKTFKAKIAPTTVLGPFTGIFQVGPARTKRPLVLAEELLERGCAYIQKGIWDEAEREFEKAVKMAPDYAEAHNNIGLCRLVRGEVQSAVESFNVALKSFPDWIIAETNLGLAWQRLERHADAAAAYKAALARNKNQPNVWLSLGDVNGSMNKPDDALKAYQTALSIAPNFGLAHCRIGMHHLKSHKFDDAENSFKEALKLDENIADAAAMLAAIVARKGDLARARSLYQQANRGETAPLQAKRGLQKLQLQEQSLQNAFDELKRAMPETRSVAECFFDLGAAQLKEGNEAAASDAFQQAWMASPDWCAPRLYLGLFAAKNGDARSARQHLEAVLAVQPEHGIVVEQLGYLAMAMGMQKEAEAQFRNASALGRNIPPEFLQIIPSN